MKNIRDGWIHGPMNAKENAITNFIFFQRSSGEIP
jgi:hypothetical protein